MWMAVIQFNLLPSVLFLTMLSTDKISAGGPRLLLRSLACLVATCVAASALLGFPVALATPMPVVLGCLPLLVAYPLMIGFTNHALASRISNQNRRLDEVGRTDDLTGLANRRHGLAVAEAELTRARETGRTGVDASDRRQEIERRVRRPRVRIGPRRIAELREGREPQAEHLAPRPEQRHEVCHSFVTDGRIQFLGACTHALKG